jgi:hypothetical protein
MSSDGVKTRQIIELLKARHPGPEWAHFVELSNGTGAMAHRLIDFYAFNLYPSKRYLRIAYEIKVTRADFARELADPMKREPAEALADECYFATPKGLIRPDEVPEGWGLIEIVANGLRVSKRAQQRNVSAMPVSFVASIARRSTDQTATVLPPAFWLIAGQEVDIDTLRQAASDEVKKEVEAQIKNAVRNARVEEKERYKNASQIMDMVVAKLGHSMSYPDVFAKWLDNQHTQLDPFVRRNLAQVAQMIGTVLEKDKRGSSE